eukprot:5068319-Pleurochrysis_carterae.AAC.1
MSALSTCAFVQTARAEVAPPGAISTCQSTWCDFHVSVNTWSQVRSCTTKADHWCLRQARRGVRVPA